MKMGGGRENGVTYRFPLFQLLIMKEILLIKTMIIPLKLEDIFISPVCRNSLLYREIDIVSQLLTIVTLIF